MAPARRGWFGAILDKYAGWSHGLPWETCNYTTELVRIPMPDGIHLVADLYQPLLSSPEQKPSGTILVNCPYGRDRQLSTTTVRLWAARGYQALFVSSRGTFGSEGEFTPASHDATDARAVVAWMNEQPWYSGKFATIGASYLGWTQWCLLEGPEGAPPDMKTAVICTGPHSFVDYFWATGALNSIFIFWTAFMREMLKGGREPMLMWFWRLQREVPKVFDGIPLLETVDTYFGGEAPSWLRDLLQISDRKDPLFEPLDKTNALEAAKIPIRLETGWYDIMKDQVMQQQEKLAQSGCKYSLTIGPWTHLQAGGHNSVTDIWAWLEEHLGGDEVENPRTAPLRVFVTGADEWRDLQAWPPSSTPHEFHLEAKNKLSAQSQESVETTESSFEFDPATPTPSIGSASQFALGPANEDTVLAARPDVLTFTGEPLENHIDVCGKPTVELYHTTSTPFADILVRLSDVDAKGVSRNISERYMRLDNKKELGPLHLTLSDCAHRFAQGHRLRVLIAGGAHPTYIRNLGSGEAPSTGTTMVAVRHTISHGGSSTSKIVLPVTD